MKAKKEWEEQRNHEETNGKTSGTDGNKKTANNQKQTKQQWDEGVFFKDLGIKPQEIDLRMRYLQVDISIDEQSDG